MRWLLLVWVSWILSAGAAQPVAAQVVHLPSYRVFSLQGSWLVPDRGSAVIGGVRRGGYHAARLGVPLFGPVWGVTPFRHDFVESQGVGVHATVIDHQEWDRALLAEAQATQAPSPPPSPVTAEADWIRANLATLDTSRIARSSVAELAQATKLRSEAQQAQQQLRAATLMEHGERCWQRGEYGVAATFFRQAASQAHGELKATAERRWSEAKRFAERPAERQ